MENDLGEVGIDEENSSVDKIAFENPQLSFYYQILDDFWSYY